MATYFYTKNEDGTMQIDDDYETIVSVKSGSVQANINNGELYGLALERSAFCAAFRIDAGDSARELFISPPEDFAGKLIVYVATDSNTPIYYEQFAQCNDLTPEEHFAGMEIYNGNGKLIFSTKYRTFSPFVGHYARYRSVRQIDNVYIKDDDNIDYDFLADPEWNYFEAAAMYGIDRSVAYKQEAIMGANVPGVPAWSVTVPNTSIIQSATTPWLPSLSTRNNDNEKKQIFAAGYKITKSGTDNMTISIGHKMQAYTITSALGSGVLLDINKTDNYIPYGGGAYISDFSRQFGIRGSGYIFNIFKPN